LHAIAGYQIQATGAVNGGGGNVGVLHTDHSTGTPDLRMTHSLAETEGHD
jgi:hypothetical protein